MTDDRALSTHGLARRFGDVAAVDGLDLAVPRGAVYGFLGPNGAGKTTTIRLLLGLLRPDAGRIEVLGRSLAASRREVLARVGSLVESPALYPHLTGRENLEAARTLLGLPRAQVARVLDTVALDGAADRCVAGYSLGMRQRLGLALALLGDPELLVLDEPTNGLDPNGIRAMRELIASLARERGITVFLSSHLLSEVEQVATHVGIVGRGRLLFQGTLAELSRRRAPELRVDVESPEEAERALRRAGWAIRGRRGRTLLLPLLEPDAVPRVNELLVRSGLAVHHLARVSPPLEEMFFELTEIGFPEVAHA